MQLHIPRLLGLTMLNATGIKALNGMATMFFNLSDATSIYSYRAMISSSPADYVAALTAVNHPMLIVVGSQDEAFIASNFPDTVAAHSAGEVVLIENATHNSVYENAGAITAVQTWIETNHQFAVTQK